MDWMAPGLEGREGREGGGGGSEGREEERSERRRDRMGIFLKKINPWRTRRVVNIE